MPSSLRFVACCMSSTTNCQLGLVAVPYYAIDSPVLLTIGKYGLVIPHISNSNPTPGNCRMYDMQFSTFGWTNTEWNVT